MDDTVVQQTTVHVETGTFLTIEYKATLGELLIATLLMVLIALFLTKWFHGLIFGRDR